MPKLNMETLLPFIEEAFNRGADFQIPITGTSMNPLLYQNRDFVKIVKPDLPLKIGDIPLYRRNDGAFVLHRVVGIKENGEYIMCGDNQFILEYGITDKNIIGIAKILVIDGQEIDVDTNTEYLKHKEKYLKNLNTRYPARRLRYKLHLIKKSILKCGVAGSEAEQCAFENSEVNINEEKITQDIIATGELLISAIRAYITETEFEFPENTDFKKLYNLAQNHRVTAMVAPMVMKSNVADGQMKGAFSKELFKTAARYTAQEKERQELSKEFSKQEIHHCFLKGSKVGSFYTNPDCRYMLDMDLYVESQKYQQAEKILLSRGYEVNSYADEKDTGYIKKPFLIVELHRELKYDYDKGYDYYKGAFRRMTSADGYAMNMTNEDFYVYILSHTAHHFETAGTGIKSIVDHYFLRENLKPKCDSEILEKALSEIGLDKFSQKLDKVCDFWFENDGCDSLTKEMSDYIIMSGVFGNETNSYLSGIIRGEYSDNADSYFLKRLFPPLKIMRNRYTILRKFPFLLPIFWDVRIITSLVNPERLVNETRMVTSVDSDQKDKQKQFFDNMGL